MCGIIGVVGSTDTLRHCSRASRDWSTAATTRRASRSFAPGETWRARTAVGTESVRGPERRVRAGARGIQPRASATRAGPPTAPPRR